jgi:hypothetical protein
LLCALSGRAQVTISEFMASNSRTLRDADGDYPDWLELYNAGDAAVSLLGWYLTDDNADLRKWRFPDVTLGPRGFLVVFASAKNRAVADAELHTSFNLNADGEYLALVKPDGVTIASAFSPQYPPQHQDIAYGQGQSVTTNVLLRAGSAVKWLVPISGALGTTWTQRGFNDAPWVSGTTAVGYETTVPGAAVRYFKAAGAVSSIDEAEAVIANPALQAGTAAENAPVVNYLGTGAESHYGNSRPFPGTPAGADIEDFVVEATGTITVPAGDTTFGVNSDDGFKLTVGASFTMSFPQPRAPADTVGVFNSPTQQKLPFRLVFYERGGGSCLEFFAAKGVRGAWDATNFRLVGDTANGGLAVESLPIGGGAGGAGYRSLIKTDVQSQMKDRSATIYLRHSFTVAEAAAVRSLTLRVRYDDGFVAYLNGQELARRNAPATPAWNSTATAERPRAQALVYEEINVTPSLSALVSGVNVLGLHGLNEAASDTDFLLDAELVEYQVAPLEPRYFATASPGGPNSKGFFAFVADTKFSVNRGFFTQPFTVTISTATPGATIRYTTDGKPPTATTGTLYTGPITINKTTVLRAAAFADGYEPSNVDTQTYLFLDDVIRQSPDGQPPPGWPASWGSNTVDYGMDPDVVNHPAYSGTIKDDLKSVPTFSIVMDLNDLFNPSTGIYANPGQDGRSWERPCSVELIHPTGAEGFQINAGIRIRGGFSRSTGNPKHAFRLFFRNEYGAGKLKFPLLGDTGTETFDGIDLRTFQNYSWSFQGDGRGIFIRDQFNRDAQLAMGHHSERGDFYHLYINGQYWGLFNTCERPEASFGATYYGGEKEDYDTIKVEAGPYAIFATDGTMDAWTRLYNLAKQDLSQAANYERLLGNNADGTRNPAYEELVDLDNLIDYLLVIFYGGNLDAPISNFLGNTSPNNWFGLRNRTGLYGGFRFFVHDAEHTLLNVNENRTGPYPAGDSSVTQSSPQWLFQRMEANLEFRVRVGDRVHKHFFNRGVLTPETARQLFLRRKNEIDRAVVGESARWGDAKRATPFTRNNEWVSAINNVLNNYLPQRTQNVLNQLKARNLYPSIVAPTFSPSGGNVARGTQLTMSAPAGTIFYTLDGRDPRRRGGGGAILGARIYAGPITLNESAIVKARVLSGGNWSALNELPFVVIQNYTELLLTELMYNPPAATNLDDTIVDGDEFEFIELKNVAALELDLSGVHFTSGVNFTFPLGTRLGPGQFVVLVSNPTAFASRYPNTQIFGTYQGRLANGGEPVTLVHATGTPIFSASYRDQAPWPPAADGAGFSVVPVNPNANADPNNAANWRASARLGGSPGADDPPLSVPLVRINEALTHTDPPILDAIELHNPNPFPVDIGGWFLSDDDAVPKKFRIPPGSPRSKIAASGFVVFDERDFNPQPGVDPSFTLNSHGEEVWLFSADAAGNLTGFADGFSFGAAANAVTFGRYVNSVGEILYPAQKQNTLGSPNAGPSLGPVVITEIHYRPAPGDEEFAELFNLTDSPVKLYDPAHPTNTWRLNGVGFDFPRNTEISAKGLMLLVGGDPAAFRTRHSVPASVPIFGPYPGTLQDNGELLELQRPDAPDVDTNGVVFVPYITVDAVRYNDRLPWPTNAAGLGPSLERIKASAYGNDPANWRASPGAASPGLDNTGNRLPRVNAGADQQVDSAQFPVDVALQATVEDDGQPNPPGQLNLQWSKVSGPDTVGFADSSQARTTASLPGVGAYVLRLTASDGALQAEDTVTIRVDRPPLVTALVPAGSTWKYLDNGSNQGTAWREPGFSDASWKSGKAQLGYGDGDEAKVIEDNATAGYNSGDTDRFITSYFRRTFTVANAATVTSLTLRLMRDDGAVVYLNGAEVFRSNMPEGTITSTTRASEVVGGGDESNFFTRDVDPQLLSNGDNLLAVEVHQQSPASSDVSFDLELSATISPLNQAPVVNAGPDQTVTMGTPADLAGSASDDGLPDPPGLLAVQWSKVNGPGDVAFGNARIARTIVLFTAPGVYVLRLTAADGQDSITDDVAITVTPGNPVELRIDSAELVTDPAVTFVLRFTAQPGRSYTVQSRDSVTGGAWLPLKHVEPQRTPQLVEVADPVSSARPSRFYRIVSPKQP